MGTRDDTPDRVARARPEADLATEAARQRARAALLGVPEDAPAVGRFRVRDRIGRGAMGTVYAAHDPTLDREVALKVVPARGGRERVLGEARAQARVVHPNVVAIYEVIEQDDDVVIAMERVVGVDLRRWLGARPRRWREVCEVFAAAGRGLAAAHARDLVHGDFKPENVLVGDDGRARVADFGLARPAGKEVAASSPVGGTPAYMAPELLDGGEPTAASDQYAFAVSLYEGLAGQRPSRTGDEASAPPRARAGRTPGRLVRLLERGLSRDPRARFPSMDELVDALEGIVRGRRRAVLVSAGVAAGVLVTLAGARFWPDDATGAAACRTRARAFDQLWTADRIAGIQRAFARSGRPFAPSAARQATRAVSDYGERWAAAARATCDAASSGSQSAELFDLRMQCLDRSLTAVDALAAIWSQGAPATVDRALDAVSALPAVAACEDAEALRARPALPADSARRREIDLLERRLARADALFRSGAQVEGRDEAAAVVSASKATGYAPLIAAAHHLLGSAQVDLGEPLAAAASFEAAAAVAAAAGDDAAFASATVELLGTKIYLQARADEVSGLIAIVGPMVERVDDPRLLGQYRALQAELRRSAGDGPGCLARYEEALALYTKRERNERAAVRILSNMAGCLHLMGRADEATRKIDEARDRLTRALGPDHPDHVDLLHVRAHAVLEREGGRAAEPLQREALAAAEKSYGLDTVPMARMAAALADNLAQQGRHAEARDLLRRAVPVLRRASDRMLPTAVDSLGKVAVGLGDLDEGIRSHEEAIHLFEARGQRLFAANAINSLGTALRAAGRGAEARARFEAALATWEEVLGAEHPRVAIALSNLGELELAEGRPAQAEARCRRALAIDEAHLGADNPDLAYDLTCLGNALVARGAEALALPLLERAARLRAAGAGDLERGQTDLALSRALWPTSSSRPRARRLAREALAALRRAKATAELPAAEAWLARIQR